MYYIFETNIYVSFYFLGCWTKDFERKYNRSESVLYFW
jgi:hypothetical protein